MPHILILGAGRSAHSLIQYLLKHSETEQWKLRIGDLDVRLAAERLGGHPNGEAFAFNVHDEEQRKKEVQNADVILSMLPASLHYLVARDCVSLGRHLITASYISDEIRALDAEARQKGILLLNEIGLDPGIDHLSAMQVIHRLKSEGAEIKSFKSYAGGLVAPEYDTNPWHYKFTWNPRNVVLAGKGTASYIQGHRPKYVPYQRIFSYLEPIHFPELPDLKFEAYPNRDSLRYRNAYGMSDIPTMLRGTIRYEGFCKMWDSFVRLGLTSDEVKLSNSATMTYREFVNSFLQFNPSRLVEDKFADFLGLDLHGVEMSAYRWLGLFDSTPIGMPDATPADALQQLLEGKWGLAPDDKDMIVMQHQFRYQKADGTPELLISSMTAYGEDDHQTAMAKTVGYPLAIATKLLLQGKLRERGVLMPVSQNIYEPVLQELDELGIRFIETTQPITKDELTV